MNKMSLEMRDDIAANNARRQIDPRGLPVRFSRLRTMARSPMHYFASCQADSDDSLARRMGRAAHALVLDQPLAIWDERSDSGRSKPRVGSAWEEFKAAHIGIEIVNPREFSQAKGISDSIRRHPIAAPMIYEGSLLEHAVDWTHPLGRRCASHIDIYRRGSFVADLKTARDGSIERFCRAAIWSSYHCQVSFYSDAVASIGDPISKAFIIAVESQPPYAVTVLKLTDRALEAGRRQCHLWMEMLLNCERSNSWPSYSDSIVDLDIPDDAGGFSLIVDGSDVEF